VRVLVAGASGSLGRQMLGALRRRGHAVRALARDPARLGAAARDADEVAVADAAEAGDALVRACEGVDAVFSALGGTTRFDAGPNAPFRALDVPPNANLIGAAERAGVERFGYVSLFNADRLRGLEYVDAHEEVVERLHASGLAGTVVRANGFFSVYEELLPLARRGAAAVVGGDPEQRDNPIHQADLAEACADALEAGAPEVAVGGPEVLTRREEVALAYRAVGREAEVPVLPSEDVRRTARELAPRDPRRAAMLEFLVALGDLEMVAPAHGERRLGDYLRERAAAAD
jgi:uncharacterized protein YbjT (DUF2867 family)